MVYLQRWYLQLVAIKATKHIIRKIARFCGQCYGTLLTFLHFPIKTRGNKNGPFYEPLKLFDYTFG